MSGDEYLREQAARCRRLASGISDAATIATLLKMAEDFERRALEGDAPTNEIPPPVAS